MQSGGPDGDSYATHDCCQCLLQETWKFIFLISQFLKFWQFAENVYSTVLTENVSIGSIWLICHQCESITEWSLELKVMREEASFILQIYPFCHVGKLETY